MQQFLQTGVSGFSPDTVWIPWGQYASFRVEKTKGSHLVVNPSTFRFSSFKPSLSKEPFPPKQSQKRRPVVASQVQAQPLPHVSLGVWSPLGLLGPYLQRWRCCSVGTVGGVETDPPPPGLQAPLASAKSVRPIAPSLSFQVQLRCSVTVTEPGSWQPPPRRRQQRLPRRRTRVAGGTYLAKCAPGLSCIETFSSLCTRKGESREGSSRAAGSEAPREHK